MRLEATRACPSGRPVGPHEKGLGLSYSAAWPKQFRHVSAVFFQEKKPRFLALQGKIHLKVREV